MKGTQHFGRMNYNVRRGLREIVAPSHKMAMSEWEEILQEFSHQCAYCGGTASAANRGIVPDHLVAVTEYGELVPGNTVPACQTCNDSRGNKNWRLFLQSKAFPDTKARIARIDEHLNRHQYLPSTPEDSLSPDELMEYNALLAQWGTFLKQAQKLRTKVALRRSVGS